ncbi:MAG: hypothetical protein DI626_11830 [Micavibrio aeruginosavorus]|uniref:Uncharacterized protein n=1 Tax=Micavibrio aeruginosavorus TaxID=349221 RepID=A0A2W4ZAE8_9BACT|nr:MAG: hypothetical protein DI626_11830 [Micavibrio aeruginosavorus]
MATITFIPRTTIECALQELINMGIVKYSLTDNHEHCFVLRKDRAISADGAPCLLNELFNIYEVITDCDELDLDDYENDNGDFE